MGGGVVEDQDGGQVIATARVPRRRRRKCDVIHWIGAESMVGGRRRMS